MCAVLQGPESRACIVACVLALFNQATASTGEHCTHTHTHTRPCSPPSLLALSTYMALCARQLAYVACVCVCVCVCVCLCTHSHHQLRAHHLPTLTLSQYRRGCQLHNSHSADKGCWRVYRYVSTRTVPGPQGPQIQVSSQYQSIEIT